MTQPDGGAFGQALRARVRGGVSFDAVTLGIYATDASIYQVTPAAVVEPMDEADVRAAVEVAREHGVTVLPRGGGTSLGGQAVGASMVLDFSKHLDTILEVNAAQRWVRVQPGVVLDNLNAALSAHGLHFAPDPATSSRATIGGMIGNNSSGTRSLIYGLTRDHVLEMRVLLSDGSVIELKDGVAGARVPDDSRERQLEGAFRAIIESNREEIARRFPKVMRRVQGYNLDAFLEPGSWNLSKLMVGSEGTLGVTLEAKLNLEPLPRHKSLCAVHFADLLDAVGSVAHILEHGPSAVEILDADVITLARRNLAIAPLCGFIEGDPQAVLVVEFFGDTLEGARNSAHTLAEDLRRQERGYSWPVITEPGEQANVWNLRKNGLGLMLGIKGDRKPIAFIEDACVPIDVLPEYIRQILDFCGARGVPVAMYAHASVGTIHVRPTLDLKQAQDIDSMKEIAEFAFGLVQQYGGAWSGEHGDGRVRSPFLERYFGPEVYAALRQVKALFDPIGLMNPGPIIDPEPMDANLRYGTGYRTFDGPTSFHYRDEGAFAGAVEMCNGVGACRQTLAGTMCPSYRATRDEEHSTRGRANALRLAMSGQLGSEALSSRRLFEVMDLCLSCKSCKSECPSNVDVSRLKSEFLQAYHDAHGVSLRERMIANAPTIAAKTAGWKATFANALMRSRPFRKALEWVTGLDARRVPPRYARVPLARWFSARPKPRAEGARRVVLFDDTFMNYHETQVGISAVELLESCGYEVVLAQAGCCQRPRISHGFLREAKAAGERTLRNLDRTIAQGLTIVVCEPSCCSALTDDLPDLVDDEALGDRIKQNVVMIDVFLAREIEAGALSAEFVSPHASILVHGHCHQKALYGTTAMTDVLRRVPGLSVVEIDAGCCGMAGSFGYEREHYDLSHQIGEERLFPAIRARESGSVIVACGFSCRHQIADATGADVVHWVETVRGRTPEA